MPAKPIFKAVVSSLAIVSLVGCGWFKRSNVEALNDNVVGLEPQVQPGRTQMPSTELPALTPGANRLNLSSDRHIPVRYVQGQALIPVEGLLSEAGFARVQANASLLKLSRTEKYAQMHQYLRGIVDKIGAQVKLQDTFFAPEVGYFSGYVAISNYPLLRDISGLPADILLAPQAQVTLRPHSAARETISSSNTDPSFADFSGIERMGVSQFVDKVQSELGAAPSGRRVQVGVTDTGVTYGHPAFLNENGSASRIVYMKDFTSEGAGFVAQSGQVRVTRVVASADQPLAERMVAVKIDANYLPPRDMASFSSEQGELPFKSLSGESFLLPKDLLAQLEKENSQVRLGEISELAFASEEEKVDINGNGKTDDSFFFFFVPGSDSAPAQTWIDFSGTKNFSASQALEDFNLSKKTTDVLSEKIGVSITELEIPAASENRPVEKLTRVALVGYDPGNHGSHVSGIIASRRTLSNDAAGTLARGVATEASLMVNRVCANNGGCNATRAIIDLARNGARIINMSLGGLSFNNDGYGVQETVVNRLTELYDVLFVISAGNSGPGRQTVGSPSTARHALSVAATATPNMILRQYNWMGRGSPLQSDDAGDDDFVMFFSSRGPTAAGGFKPNISAPGTQLSSIQLNSARGNRAGADVYWGTSMAAPAASGAAALLLDAALLYNEKNPNQPMPTDALTLRRILLDSARPFRVSSFNPKTGVASKGIYSWIDQGYGMVSLPQAWELLKKKAAQNLSTGVVIKSSDASAGGERPAALGYQVRVLRGLGNGLKYDGSQSFDTGSLVGEKQTERKFGQGVWLSEKEADSLVEINLSRELGLKNLSRADVGDLLRQLNTSSESFELETIFYGSRTPWLKVGVPWSVSCEDESTPENSRLTLIGAGAIPTPVEPGAAGSLIPLRASSLFVCLKKDAFAQLTPGDHGAMIRAYRVVNGQRDALASFEIPVYLTVPHHSLAMQAQFSEQRQIKSFMVDRHYVRIPEGVSVLRVALEVPAVGEDGVKECSGVSMMVLAGSNTAAPKDLTPTASLAQSCSSLGAPINNRRVAKFSELNPKAGLWDVHVFGRYQFPLSSYKLDIDYATFADIPPLNLNPANAAAGEFVATLKESTFDAAPDASKSSIQLNALVGRSKHEIAKSDGPVVIPSAAGQLARVYADDAGTVTITTTSIVPGLDIDLTVDECNDAELKTCQTIAQSGSATADERAVFLPKAGKFYAVRIDPFEVPADKAVFSATEIINAHEPEVGSLRVAADTSNAASFKIAYALETTKSRLLSEPLFVSGKYEIEGSCKLANSAGIGLVSLPVHVLSK